jgi:hypothetical protein
MNVQIIKYSEKAIVVIGDTKPIKDVLKGAGGKFNARLTHPITHKPLMGWIFARTKESVISGLLSANNVKVDRVTPDNINDQNVNDYIQDPAEIDADNFCQRNNI